MLHSPSLIPRIDVLQQPVQSFHGFLHRVVHLLLLVDLRDGFEELQQIHLELKVKLIINHHVCNAAFSGTTSGSIGCSLSFREMVCLDPTQKRQLKNNPLKLTVRKLQNSYR